MALRIFRNIFLEYRLVPAGDILHCIRGIPPIVDHLLFFVSPESAEGDHQGKAFNKGREGILNQTLKTKMLHTVRHSVSPRTTTEVNQ